MPAVSSWVLGGRYRVIDRLGDGAMAEVLRAEDLVLGREVAVKVFRSSADTADGSDGVRRREMEVHALAALSHPNLITLYDASFGGQGQPPYLVMELVPGPTLAERLQSGPLPEPEVRQLAIQLADALTYVHELGMVHRDIKPANIMLGSEPGERARLSDFGIVRMLGTERMTTADFTVGTATYLSPEQARGIDVDYGSDVYSLGLVLIEALAGQKSFPGPAHEAVLARLTRAPEIPAGLPSPWPSVLAAMMSAEKIM